MQACPGIHTLRWTAPPPTSPLSFAIFNPSPTPSKPPLPSPSVPHPQLAAEDGFSESSWDGDQRQITATSMQNVTWKPPSYVLTIDSALSTSIPSLSGHPFLLISLLHFYRSAVQRSVKFEEKKVLPKPFTDETEKAELGGGCPWLCLFAFTVHFVM